jgi:arsenate reductase (thioredoxin)
MNPPKVVLFICVGNAGRSLMAEALFNANPPPGWVAMSAGTRPAAQANPRTLLVLREVGVSPPNHPPQELTAQMMDEAKIRVTMGCLDDASCPARLKSLEVRDWALPDPAHLDDAGFREVRDRITGLVKGLRTEIVISDRRQVDRKRTPPEPSR